MKYMGSKARYANSIIPIIQKRRESRRCYVEPFVGGFNLIDKVIGPRIGNDHNYYLTELFKAVQNGWKPPTTVTEALYVDVKTNKEKYPPSLVGFVSFGCSYAGKEWGGYARSTTNKGVPRNHAQESANAILRQYNGIQGIHIKCGTYTNLYIPKKSCVYCDPPYQGTTKYRPSFDSEPFFNWVRDLVKEGHSVFVSEYTAPIDFVSVWEQPVTSSLTLDTGAKKAVEKLFVHESQR